jgi:hypothetical protein
VECHAVEVRYNLVNGLWRGAGKPFGQDGLNKDILIVEEEHGVYRRYLELIESRFRVEEVFIMRDVCSPSLQAIRISARQWVVKCGPTSDVPAVNSQPAAMYRGRKIESHDQPQLGIM